MYSSKISGKVKTCSTVKPSRSIIEMYTTKLIVNLQNTMLNETVINTYATKKFGGCGAYYNILIYFLLWASHNKLLSYIYYLWPIIDSLNYLVKLIELPYLSCLVYIELLKNKTLGYYSLQLRVRLRYILASKAITCTIVKNPQNDIVCLKDSIWQEIEMQSKIPIKQHLFDKKKCSLAKLSIRYQGYVVLREQALFALISSTPCQCQRSK